MSLIHLHLHISETVENKHLINNEQTTQTRFSWFFSVPQENFKTAP